MVFGVYVGRELVPQVKPLFLDYYTFALVMSVAYGGLLLSVELRPVSRGACAVATGGALRRRHLVQRLPVAQRDHLGLAGSVGRALLGRSCVRGRGGRTSRGRAAAVCRVVLVRGATVPPEEALRLLPPREEV